MASMTPVAGSSSSGSAVSKPMTLGKRQGNTSSSGSANNLNLGESGTFGTDLISSLGAPSEGRPFRATVPPIVDDDIPNIVEDPAAPVPPRGRSRAESDSSTGQGSVVSSNGKGIFPLVITGKRRSHVVEMGRKAPRSGQLGTSNKRYYKMEITIEPPESPFCGKPFPFRIALLDVDTLKYVTGKKVALDIKLVYAKRKSEVKVCLVGSFLKSEKPGRENKKKNLEISPCDFALGEGRGSMPLIGESGYVDLMVTVNRLSRDSSHKFCLEVNPYIPSYEGLADVSEKNLSWVVARKLDPKLSRSMQVVKYQLVITNTLPPEWMRDPGGRRNMLELHVELRDADGNIVLDEPIPYRCVILYENGKKVENQAIMTIAFDAERMIMNGRKAISFRIKEVSRRHRNQRFMIRVEPDGKAFGVAAATSNPVKVLSKASKPKSSSVPPSPLPNSSSSNSLANATVKVENGIESARRPTISLDDQASFEESDRHSPIPQIDEAPSSEARTTSQVMAANNKNNTIDSSIDVAVSDDDEVVSGTVLPGESKPSSGYAKTTISGREDSSLGPGPNDDTKSSFGFAVPMERPSRIQKTGKSAPMRRMSKPKNEAPKNEDLMPSGPKESMGEDPPSVAPSIRSSSMPKTAIDPQLLINWCDQVKDVLTAVYTSKQEGASLKHEQSSGDEGQHKSFDGGVKKEKHQTRPSPDEVGFSRPPMSVEEQDERHREFIRKQEEQLRHFEQLKHLTSLQLIQQQQQQQQLQAMMEQQFAMLNTSSTPQQHQHSAPTAKDVSSPSPQEPSQSEDMLSVLAEQAHRSSSGLPSGSFSKDTNEPQSALDGVDSVPSSASRENSKAANSPSGSAMADLLHPTQGVNHLPPIASSVFRSHTPEAGLPVYNDRRELVGFLQPKITFEFQPRDAAVQSGQITEQSCTVVDSYVNANTTNNPFLVSLPTMETQENRNNAALAIINSVYALVKRS